MKNDENKTNKISNLDVNLNDTTKEKKIHLGKLRQQQAKAARLTKALRENLYKRKAQTRERVENKNKE